MEKKISGYDVIRRENMTSKKIFPLTHKWPVVKNSRKQMSPISQTVYKNSQNKFLIKLRIH